MINSNATFFGEIKTGGWGCIVWDSDGEVLFAALGKLSGISKALQAEAMALMKAIHMAGGIEMGHIIFLTTCP